MTSSLKKGIIVLGVAGVGLGAYLVNFGLKNDKGQKAAEPVQLASAEMGQAPAGLPTEAPKATPAMEPVVAPPAPATPTPIASTADHTGQAASPAPLGLHDGREDTERSWRPRPLETSEAQPAAPAVPATDLTSQARPEEGARAGAGSGPIAAPPAPASHTPEPGRMSLQEQPTATQPAKTDQTAVAKAGNGTPAAPEKMTIHVVQAGDTFSGLANKYLGSPKHINLIEKANPKINPNRIYVGTKLKIPAAPEASKAAPAASTGGTPQAPAASTQKPKTTAPPADPAKAYTVKPGDSWSSLAAQHLGGANWTVLYEYNKERFPPNARTLQPGMVIEIPSKDEVAGRK